MPWSKFTPNEEPLDPLGASSDSAGRRVWILKWGWRISQAMFYLGIVFLFYWIFTRA